jgi:hypothetical protein
VADLCCGGLDAQQGIEFADTCFGVGSSCTPSAQIILTTTTGVELGAATPDGRYLGYTRGDNASYPTSAVPYLYDTCAGAPPGCTPQTVQLNANGQLAFMDSQARYMLLSEPWPTKPGEFGEVNLHDSCIAAAPGCTPTDTLLTNPAKLCMANFLSGDAQYATYSCAPNDATLPWNYQGILFTTCIGQSSCTPTTVPEPLYNIVSVSSDGRFLLGQTYSSVSSHVMASVYDTCTGAPGTCIATKQDLCFDSTGAIANADCIAVGMTPDGKYLFINSGATNMGEPNGGTFLLTNPLHP